MRERKLVVAGLIGSELSALEGKMLVTKRRPDQPLPNQWELPGGKVELGESPEAALARELQEEIGVTATVGAIWDVMFHHYPDFDVVMLIYKCLLAKDADPQAVEVSEWRWVTPVQLQSYDVLAADIPLVARLCREGLPGFQASLRGA